MELAPDFASLLQGLSVTRTAPTFASLTTVLTGTLFADMLGTRREQSLRKQVSTSALEGQGFENPITPGKRRRLSHRKVKKGEVTGNPTAPFSGPLQVTCSAGGED